MKTICIYFSEFEKIKFGFIQQQRILIIQKKNSFPTYITIPSTVTFKLFPDKIEFNPITNVPIFMLFSKFVTQLRNTFSPLVKKKLILQGLGFKIDNSEAGFISLKLGYSHSVRVSIPNFIKQVKISKNVLLLESSDQILLGNFINKLYNLRKVDSYKEKGFSYPYTVRKLKIIKKK